MNCSKAHKLISPYIDGELSEREVSVLENHLKVCPNCWTEVEEMKGLHKLFVNTEKFEAPYGFHTRVMGNVNATKTKKMPGISIPVRLAEAAIVLVLIAIGIMSGSFLVKGIMPGKAPDVIASLHLDVFEYAPPGTLGGAYLAMTEGRNEK